MISRSISEDDEILFSLILLLYHMIELLYKLIKKFSTLVLQLIIFISSKFKSIMATMIE